MLSSPCRYPTCHLTALPISSAPTLLPTTPIALANGSRHETDDTAFDAGTTLETARGREGDLLFYFPT